MNSYVIGIGGTGARCIEAFTHLCAAGMMPNSDSVYCLFVDADVANGNVERAQTTQTSYTNCQNLQLGRTDLFKTKIIRAEPDLWSPVPQGNGGQIMNLSTLFEHDQMNASKDYSIAADLFAALFTPLERMTPLDKGFRGHPSIGAAVMAKTIELDSSEPWKTFKTLIEMDLNNNQGTPKVFIFGSIFGGTGAAGFPTIASLVNQLIQGRKGEIGGALLLPYFSFIDPAAREIEMKAHAEDFLMNTQAALRYYESLKTDVFKAIYLLGDDTLTPVETFSIGAREQRNDSHFIELFAALAACDFFGKSYQNRNQTEFPMVARRKEGVIEWEDLPSVNGDSVRSKLGTLVRFAFSYLQTYYPMLLRLRDHGGEFQAPWYVDHIKRAGLNYSDIASDADAVANYCRSLLDWIEQLHRSASGQVISLVDCGAFSPAFRPELFGSLLQYASKAETSDDLNKLWKRASSGTVKDPEARRFGKLIRLLYDNNRI